MKRVRFLISLIVICAFASFMTFLIYKFNCYPIGNDVYGHLFKVEKLYNSIKQGVYYPLYVKNWYSGLELFRYWPPLAYYFCCIFMFLFDNIYTAYLCFIGSTFVIGATGWLLFGYKENKLLLATIFGILYMMLPDNMRVLLTEGNMPRIFITALLPWFFFFLCEVLRYNNFRAMKYMVFTLILITFAHLMISAMVGLTVGVLVIIYALVYKEVKREFWILMHMASAYLITGIILVPGLIGGIVTQSSASSQRTSSEQWSELAIVSLNPTIRLHNTDSFYFGVSLFVIIILGLLVMHKETIPYLSTSLLIFIGTTMIVVPILSVLPVNQVFWMIRFVPMAECCFLIGLLYWKDIKPSVLIVLISLLLFDSIISLVYLPNNAYRTKDNRELMLEERYLLDEACDITVNQLAIMDLSNIGSYTSYIISKDDRDIQSLFGWAYQGAYTIEEIVQLNEAFEKGYYTYVLDRLEHYCCDTIVIKKDEVDNIDELFYKIESSSYNIIDENDYAILLHNEQKGPYGVIQKQENVCIGVGSEAISYLYPSFYKLRDNYLDNYTFDDLKDYKKIFLSGPYYKDKKYGEDLIYSLAESGVQIYVDMNNLQDDKSSGRNSFLGVVAQPITFTKTFPILEKENGSQFKLSPYVNEQNAITEWKTVYFTNLFDIDRVDVYKNNTTDYKELAYLGHSVNENITFIGFNLVYYCYVNKNAELYSFLDEIFDVDREYLVDKEYVPITTEIMGNTIVLSSNYDNVTTGIANLDSFTSIRNLGKETFVSLNKGITEINVVYAHFKEGLLVSIFGVFMSIFCFIKSSKYWRKVKVV